MKKLFSAALSLIIILFSFVGCESEQEKARRRIEEANRSYERQARYVESIENELGAVRERIAELEGRK